VGTGTDVGIDAPANESETTHLLALLRAKDCGRAGLGCADKAIDMRDGQI
jgi:hypothetical protein